LQFGERRLVRKLYQDLKIYSPVNDRPGRFNDRPRFLPTKSETTHRLRIAMGQISRTRKGINGFAVYFQTSSASSRQPAEQYDSHRESHLLAGDAIDECFEDAGKTRRPHATKTPNQRTKLRFAVGKSREGAQIGLQAEHFA
jgi:hypothetical protein